jgi:signal transduction histidine kinase
MTGLFLLDWSIISLSLFNSSLMLWLAATIALNAERPSATAAGRAAPAWGTALIAGSLLMGGMFFVSHSAILAFDLNTVSRGLNFWWRVGWWPVLALPLAWYVLVLWYSGYWGERDTALRRRHRPWLRASGVFALVLVLLVWFANPLPALGPLPRTSLLGPLSLGGVPLLILAYPIFILLCVGLALDALLRPGPTGRMLGDLARRRARPWLAAASGLLLLVSVLVAAVMLWIVRRLSGDPTQPLILDASLALTVAWFDLAISGLIALALLLLGQALVAYEVFTGKTLPRRGLLRFWRNAVVLAAGYGLVAGWSLTLQLRPVYVVLLSTILLSAFYALFSWRAYAERERYMRQLRPFVAGQPLYAHLLEEAHASPAGEGPASTAETAAATISFRALCREVLGARLAYLVPLGPSAALAGEPLVYAGPGAPPPPAGGLASLAALAGQVHSRQDPLLAIEPAQAGGAQVAIPLWSQGGASQSGGNAGSLLGLLLLGEKSDGGLYTQEEIDIARAGGERLIDALAGAELARRLLALQRQRLAESQVLDQRTRRVLHDDVLPQLHAALLHLHALPPQPAAAEAQSLLAGAHRQLSELLRELPAGPAPGVGGLGLADALRRLVSVEFPRAFDAVAWDVTPEAEARARALPPLAAEVLFYAAREAVRNAARHGRGADPAQPLNLRLGLHATEPDGLALTVEDNGPGLAAAPVAVEKSAGAGQGLALHGTLLAVVGGTLALESEPGAFTRVRLTLPAGTIK